jgi:hypothetical protein
VEVLEVEPDGGLVPLARVGQGPDDSGH